MSCSFSAITCIGVILTDDELLGDEVRERGCHCPVAPSEDASFCPKCGAKAYIPVRQPRWPDTRETDRALGETGILIRRIYSPDEITIVGKDIETDMYARHAFPTTEEVSKIQAAVDLAFIARGLTPRKVELLTVASVS